MAAIETLRPTPVAITIYRGQDNQYVFTVIDKATGLPKDMSGYAALVPMARFSSASRSAGGVVPGLFAQAQISSGNELASLGVCDWLNGGVGGQIRMIIPEADFADGITKGSKNANATLITGVGDIQVRGAADIASIGATSVETGGGSTAAYNSVQRAIEITWSIDKEVTNLP